MKSVPFTLSDFNPDFTIDEVCKLINRFRLKEYFALEAKEFWIASTCADVVCSLYMFIGMELNDNETQNETE